MKHRIAKRKNDRSLKLPILGKIKMGKKVKNKKGTEYPTSLDHFICEDKYAKYFHDAYGPEPKKIEVVFVSDNLADSCTERYELRDKQGRLFGYGDGNTFEIWSAKKEDYVTVSTDDRPDVMEEAEKKSGSQKGWEILLEMRFVIPKIPGVFGLWRFITKGKESTIPSVVDSFDHVQQMAGSVVNVPFDLVVEKVKSQKPGQARTFPVANLICNISKTNLENLGNYIEEHGNTFRGLITESRIESEIPKQLEGQISTEKPDLPNEDVGHSLYSEPEPQVVNSKPGGEPEEAEYEEIEDDDEYSTKLKEFHAVGVECYGKDGWDEARPQLVSWITNGKQKSSKDLSLNNLGILIQKMRKRINERGE